MHQTRTPPASVSILVQVILPEAWKDVESSRGDLVNQKKSPRSYKLHPGCSYRDAATLWLPHEYLDSGGQTRTRRKLHLLSYPFWFNYSLRKRGRMSKTSSADLASQMKTPRSLKLHLSCSYHDTATQCLPNQYPYPVGHTGGWQHTSQYPLIAFGLLSFRMASYVNWWFWQQLAEILVRHSSVKVWLETH